MDELKVIGRQRALYTSDLQTFSEEINDKVQSSSFLVIGAAGTIGQATTKEIFARNPKALHAVDISENNLVELVRDIRSSLGYIEGDFRTFAIDCGTIEFETLVDKYGPYDYVLNLSALKHVRSEKDPYTLMRLVNTNIINTTKILSHPLLQNSKHFCVSTDKAANPVNLMGASKSIMEQFVCSSEQPVSMARFANVAFSDGSLLHGFNQRILKSQPISAPTDVQRYFVTQKEAGELYLLSTLLGENSEIFFPKDSHELKLTSFSDIAERYLKVRGYIPKICETEAEARELASKSSGNIWPCYFFESDTTGEKPYEEFYTSQERIITSRYEAIGVVKKRISTDRNKLKQFLEHIEKMKLSRDWSKLDILQIQTTLPKLSHEELNKNLDERM